MCTILQLCNHPHHRQRTKRYRDAYTVQIMYQTQNTKQKSIMYEMRIILRQASSVILHWPTILNYRVLSNISLTWVCMYVVRCVRVDRKAMAIIDIYCTCSISGVHWDEPVIEWSHRYVELRLGFQAIR